MATSKEIELQLEIQQLEYTLRTFKKIVVIDGMEYMPGYPLCQGCDELTLARGWECYYKRTTTECKYPEDVLRAVKEAQNEGG